MISAFRSVAMFSTCRVGDTAGNKTFWYYFIGVYIYSNYFAMYGLELKAARNAEVSLNSSFKE